MPPTLAERIDAALPQTQCTRCGYPDCAAYAQAIAQGAADINQCPPGGVEGIARLAALTGRAPVPLNPKHGAATPRGMAVIDEAWCIGCTLCLKACPTDAIVGLPKRMHTIMAQHCTGCELCLPACPVDCIQMQPVSGEATGWAAWSPIQAKQARARYHARQARLHPPNTATTNTTQPATDAKRAAIATALARAKKVQPVGPIAL